MNGIAEAVRQVRGTSVNQVPGDGPVLVTAGTGVPTSGLILSLPSERTVVPPLQAQRTRAAACGMAGDGTLPARRNPFYKGNSAICSHD
jgi:hypothetical protein